MPPPPVQAEQAQSTEVSGPMPFPKVLKLFPPFFFFFHASSWSNAHFQGAQTELLV